MVFCRAGFWDCPRVPRRGEEGGVEGEKKGEPATEVGTTFFEAFPLVFRGELMPSSFPISPLRRLDFPPTSDSLAFGSVLFLARETDFDFRAREEDFDAPEERRLPSLVFCSTPCGALFVESDAPRMGSLSLPPPTSIADPDPLVNPPPPDVGSNKVPKVRLVITEGGVKAGTSSTNIAPFVSEQ